MFKEIPASKKSLWLRRLIYNVATNDAWYQVKPVIEGKQYTCPFYKRWLGVLERCYSTKWHESSPTYKGCTICEEWLTFSNFRSWMVEQDWQDKQLDKDIIKSGNKIYSPETCIFITSQINSLLNDCGKARGNHPKGVVFSNGHGRFKSTCYVNGKPNHLGYFDTSKKASDTYKKFKSNHVYKVAMKQDQPLRGYLIRIAGEINPQKSLCHVR
jgi:hypothetical protein